MELPDLGENCCEPTCKQLDFLPMKCDACKKIFCSSHFSYEQHSCPESYKKDNQVPVCPLCNIPIPVKRGEPPDIQVGIHIDNECQSDPAKAKRKKIYTNRCSAKGCKTKELIPFTCENCRSNFCIRHRLELDHECKGFQGSGHGISAAGAAAVARTSKATTTNRPASQPQQTVLSSIGQQLERERRQRQQQQSSQPAPRNLRAMQANMTEDEALAQAMALSLSDNAPQPTPPPTATNPQEDEDLALARAIAESERTAQRDRQRGTSQRQEKDKSCSVS